MHFLSQHKILVILAAIVLAGLVWWGLAGTSSTPASLLTTQTTTQTGTTPATGSANDQALVATLLELRAVSLSGTIFTEPAFQSLKDFSTQIVPEPIGRDNPFAPLPAPATASTTRGASIFTPHAVPPKK